MRFHTLQIIRNKNYLIRRENRPNNFLGPQDACHPDELEFCLMEAGYEEVTVETKRFVQNEGHYTLIPPGAVHSSESKSKATSEIVFHFSNPFIHETAQTMGLPCPQFNFQNQIPISSTLYSFIKILKAELSEQ